MLSASNPATLFVLRTRQIIRKRPCRVSAHKHYASVVTPSGPSTTRDVVVVGSGAAGLTAALRCHYRGLRPLIVEKSSKVGGATAWSGGAVWVPNNTVHKAEGVRDSDEQGLQYLNALVGESGPESSDARRKAYVQNARKMVDFLSDMGFKWLPSTGYPDYHPNLPGGMGGGRTIESAVVDLRALGQWRKHFNLSSNYPMLPLHVFEAGTVALAAAQLKGFTALTKVMLRWLRYRLLLQDPVTMGHALAARLLKLNLDRNTEIWRDAPLQRLLVSSGQKRVEGIVVKRDGKDVNIMPSHGVILAAGGFGKNQEMRAHYQQQPTNPAWSSVPAHDTGDAIRAGMDIGAATALMDDAWWGPSFFDDTTQTSYFGLWERSRPYSIIVDKAGKRIFNEAESYVDATHAQYARDRSTTAIPAWLIMDSIYARRYPLATMGPRKSARQALKSGFLYQANTLGDLCDQIGVSKDGLAETVQRFNNMARKGRDEDFNRGGSSYDNYFGDTAVKPNPNLGAIEKAPFYAVKVFPGDLGTKGGLLTDENGQVLATDQKPIPKLYASGNTTASVMGRRYGGAGATLGPAMTFACLAVDHIAQSSKV
ncbi:uncharacterized protein Z518_01795 [Rhinocladiella mackenziei CBS 650.93]|uniref:FAD-dependent oxidoreductase 2 FAD-binding domain-containing protein n=1 Tax=Rhinocladiella mackenziei CBS 650.93 TaxID=1442369 RepID=A0A0D2J4R1_9EURO|nr:uncharacterized protein Z518_01795 [Rhinocladiella mackenziei CBS 650.93]KIX10711.1 hypothetical protein Z518_01795 [Rhinocladiella mackenziei CBS 650.93]